MSDDDFDVLERIANLVQLREVTRDGVKKMQVSIRGKRGGFSGDDVDGTDYVPGEDIWAELARLKRYVEIQKARRAKKIVPRLKRVK